DDLGPLGVVQVQDLEGLRLLDGLVLGQVHLAHAAGPEHPLHTVATRNELTYERIVFALHAPRARVEVCKLTEQASRAPVSLGSKTHRSRGCIGAACAPARTRSTRSAARPLSSALGPTSAFGRLRRSA